MNRRNIFRLAICAVAASAMEVFGMKEVKTYYWVVPKESVPRPTEVYYYRVNSIQHRWSGCLRELILVKP